MAVIELKNLTYTYGEGTPFCKKAVDNVSLSIEQGEFIGVIGHTGSGKSTQMCIRDRLYAGRRDDESRTDLGSAARPLRRGAPVGAVHA